MLENQLTRVVSASNVNLNQAQNTVLLTLKVAKPIEIRRFGVIASAAEGLLAASQLKLRKTPTATGTAADIANTELAFGATKARGAGYYGTLASRVTAKPGDTITVCVEVAAGATSTGDVFLEYAELPFQDGVDSFIAHLTEKTLAAL